VVGAVLLLVFLGRSLLPTGDNGRSGVNVTGTGRPGTVVNEPRDQRPRHIVRFNGRKVPVAEGPIAVLNPGLARPGATVNVNGSGFDPGALVNAMLSVGKGKAKIMGSDRANRDGVVDIAFKYPIGAADAGGKQRVTLAQHGSKTKIARADLISQSGVAVMKLSKLYGQPGTHLTVDAQGFYPNEKIKVYWGKITGRPSQVLQADEHGTLLREPIDVGVGPVGDNTVILMGMRSKTTAMAPFELLRQYPVVLTKPFAAKATETIHLVGKGFAPNERVLGYLGEPSGMPVIVARADSEGHLNGVGFQVPYRMNGRHSLIFVGEQSRATAKSGFLAQPYTPTVRASTWGGLPGTVLNFYAKGFAPNEAVHVYVDGELVSAFRVNSKGSAAAVGRYMIPSDAQKSVEFKMIGARSGGVGKLSVKVDKSEGHVYIPKQPKYKLPKNLRW
jgi:hypothetical protein